MKALELREKTTEELTELEGQLRDKLVRLSVAKATQRATNTAQFGALRRDIARIKTVLHERARGIAGEA
ncbi:large subunit ribosomal protein L29 [Nannocystis exedens]|uniref:Large ribosomal subunit protein uL29 n=1 Tax=Nannocystis exedens TaxID=54 RepID=A0A1I2GFM0_9BACT|nr:50S ribosomal protein L29 [Nannocystis exedens]PCC70012.1 50S ribosomal protein L29 [Nannocystis exedens]SFF15687.1 large subunit ribosomal protein L29 [Nannocystis exedens]